MKIAIFGSGNFKENDLIRKVIKTADFFIAADGGAKYLKELKIKPDIMMGDWDSIKEKDFGNIPHIDYPSHKDTTDSEIAIRYAADKNPDEIMLFGFTGSRMDHTMNNMFLLDIPFRKRILARIYNENNVIMMLSGEYEFKRDDYSLFKYFSIIPLNDGITLSLKGFEYEIEDYKLQYEDYTGLCISNEINRDVAKVKVSGGRVLGFFSRD